MNANTDRQKPHVLFVLNSLRFGGAEKHVVTLLNHIDADRFDLSLAYLKREEHLLSQVRLNQLKSVFCCDIKGKLDWQSARALAAYIDNQRVDALFCTNTYSLLYGVLARYFAKRPVKLIDVFHTTKLGTLKANIQMFFYHWLFKTADLLVYVCENQREYWRSKNLSAKRDEVIHNGIDLTRFSDNYSTAETSVFRQRFGFGSGDYVVGLCAAMRPEKAHEDLLAALVGLKAKNIPIKALLIGDGPRRSEIERRISALDLESSVGITGFLDDVRLAIASCDVMILASHHVETFSIAALEAMALGKPMVMTEIGGATEQVTDGENGLLFKPGDIEALIRQLGRMADPDLRSAMGAKARTRVQTEFSLDRMVGAYEGLLVDVVGKSSVEAAEAATSN